MDNGKHKVKAVIKLIITGCYYRSNGETVRIPAIGGESASKRISVLTFGGGNGVGFVYLGVPEGGSSGSWAELGSGRMGGRQLLMMLLRLLLLHVFRAVGGETA